MKFPFLIFPGTSYRAQLLQNQMPQNQRIICGKNLLDLPMVLPVEILDLLECQLWILRRHGFRLHSGLTWYVELETLHTEVLNMWGLR